jgi:hypothetical protein
MYRYVYETRVVKSYSIRSIVMVNVVARAPTALRVGRRNAYAVTSWTYAHASLRIVLLHYIRRFTRISAWRIIHIQVFKRAMQPRHFAYYVLNSGDKPPRYWDGWEPYSWYIVLL